MFRVIIGKQALKNLDKIPANYQKKIAEHITGLKTNPHPQGSIKMQNLESIYSLRVGMYRIVYEINGSTLQIKVITIDHRKDIYK